MSRKWRNWYQNEVDKEIKGAGSRDKVKHNEMSYRLFFREDDDQGWKNLGLKKNKVFTFFRFLGFKGFNSFFRFSLRRPMSPNTKACEILHPIGLVSY